MLSSSAHNILHHDLNHHPRRNFIHRHHQDLHALHPPGEVNREGLGQDFRESPWVPPEYEDAMEYVLGLGLRLGMS